MCIRDSISCVCIPLLRSVSNCSSLEEAMNLHPSRANCLAHSVSPVSYTHLVLAIRGAKEAGFYVIAIADESEKENEPEIKQLADKYIESFKELL